MLALFRKHRQGLLGIFVVGVCSFLMLGFGVDAFMADSRDTNIARVYEHEVTFQEYGKRLQILESQYRRQFGQNVDAFLPRIRERALDEIIDEQLFRHFTTEIGMSVSPAQIQEQIESQGYFPNGFTKAAYQQLLRQAGMTGAQLESLTRDQILRAQLYSVFQDVIAPSDIELKAKFQDEGAQYKFEFAKITPQPFEALVNTEDEEVLRAYYDETQTQYEKSREVEFSFVEFYPHHFEQNVEVLPEDIEARYMEQRSKYSQPKKVSLQQLIVAKGEEDAAESNEEATEAEGTEEEKEEQVAEVDSEEKKKEETASPSENEKKKAILEAALERVRAGDSVEAVASSFPEIDDSKLNDFSAWREHKVLPDHLRNQVGSLETGEASEVFETDDAFIVAYVREVQQPRIQEINEVRSQIESEIRRENAPLYAEAEAESFLERWQEKVNASESGVPLAEYSKSDGGREVHASEGTLSADKTPPSGRPGLTAAVIDFFEGDRRVVGAGESFYVVEIGKVLEKRIPAFEDVKDEVIAQYKKEKGKELAEEFASTLRDKLKSDPTLTLVSVIEDEAFADTFERKETELIKKADANEEPFFLAPVKQDAFILTAQNPVAPGEYGIGESYFVIRLLERKAADNSLFEDERNVLREAEITEASARFLQSLLQGLKAQALLDGDLEFFQDVNELFDSAPA